MIIYRHHCLYNYRVGVCSSILGCGLFIWNMLEIFIQESFEGSENCYLTYVFFNEVKMSKSSWWEGVLLQCCLMPRSQFLQRVHGRGTEPWVWSKSETDIIWARRKRTHDPDINPVGIIDFVVYVHSYIEVSWNVWWREEIL